MKKEKTTKRYGKRSAQQPWLSTSSKPVKIGKKKYDPLKPPMPKIVIDPNRDRVDVYSDGGCWPNGQKVNKGGYAFIVVENDTVLYRYSRGEMNTTNNRMELQGILDSLQYIKANIPADVQVVIHTDSQYCLHGICTWYKGWIKKNWENVKNTEQWKQIIELKDQLPNVQYKWVKGHQDNDSREAVYNNMVDQMCSAHIG